MKIAYLGKIQLSDVDLSYVHEAQKKADVHYFLEVNPRFMKGPAVTFDRLYPKSGVFKAAEAYPQLRRYAGYVDLDKCHVVNTTGRLWVLKAFWVNLLLLAFLVRGRFDVIHAVWPYNVYEFALYLLRRRTMLTVHDPFPHTELDTPIVKLRRMFAFRLIPELVLLNSVQRDAFIRRYGLPEGRVAVSRLGCYTCLRPLAERGNGGEAVGDYILFAGKISKYKGLRYLLPAMLEVHKAFPSVRLVVAGGGAFDFDVSPYNALPYIDIRNRFIPDGEMATLLARCRFVVCPYTEATQSGVIMSAFAFAKPVVATNVGGLPEMVRDGEFGLVVNGSDKDALSAAITCLLGDQKRLSLLSRNISEAYGHGSLSWEEIAAQLRKEYENMTKK